MGREEQIEEREVLDSIFPDEITDISDISYRVAIALDVPPGYDGEDQSPTLHLIIAYPPLYPSVPPTLTLTSPPSTTHSNKNPHLSLPTDTPHLLSTLSPTITASLGDAMIFTLISTLKENAEALIQERVDAVQAGIDKEKEEAEREENRRFEGEKVTRESFLRWREGFRGEMMERERVEEGERVEGLGRKKGRGEEEGRVSGRGLWERGLVGKTDLEEEEEGEGDGGVVGGVEGLSVQE